MPRKPRVIWALGAIVLSSSTVLFAASGEAFDRGKPAVQTSKDLSGGGDVRQRRGGSAPGARAGDAVNANPEARLSDKPAEAKRLIENPEKQDIGEDRPEGARPHPGAAGAGPEPGASIRDQSGEVR